MALLYDMYVTLTLLGPPGSCSTVYIRTWWSALPAARKAPPADQAAQIMWHTPGRMRSTYCTGCDRKCPSGEHVQKATEQSVDVEASQRTSRRAGGAQCTCGTCALVNRPRRHETQWSRATYRGDGPGVRGQHGARLGGGEAPHAHEPVHRAARQQRAVCAHAHVCDLRAHAPQRGHQATVYCAPHLWETTFGNTVEKYNENLNKHNQIYVDVHHNTDQRLHH